MVRTLLLMRHAQAADAKSDFQRPLTAMGERDARHMARWILAHYPGIDHIYSSAAVRAVSTANIVAEELKISSLTEEKDLYDASVRTMLEQVNAVGDEHQMVVLVGHNPSISYLSDYLTARPLPGMEPGSVVVIDFDDLSWSEVSQATGTLKKYQSARDL